MRPTGPRKKLRPHGITIDLVYDVGWRLSAENRKRLRSLLGDVL
jgi:hypothetical protein